MASSSTLVNVADDAELRLVRLLAEAAPSQLISASFVQDCEACIVNADASQLIKIVVNDPGAMGALLSLESVDEAISAFTILTALLARVGRDRPNDEKGLTQLLADAVVNATLDGKEPAHIATRQIALLSVIYNMRPNGLEKCSVLERMIQLAGTHQPSMLEPGQPLGDLLHEDIQPSDFSVAPSSPRLVAMLDAWDVPAQERRNLFRAVSQGISTDSARKQRFMLLFVESYKDAVRREICSAFEITNIEIIISYYSMKLNWLTFSDFHWLLSLCLFLLFFVFQEPS